MSIKISGKYLENPMRIAICDDEKVQRQLLDKYIKEWSSKQLQPLETVSFCDAEKFLFQWEEDKDFDLLVLDIEMGDLNGMELAYQLRERGERVPILFVTGYETYMAQGYEVAALHYLLKPINKEKLFEVLERLQTTQKAEKKILLQTEEGVLSIVPSDIWYVEASGHRSTLTTTTSSYDIKNSISEIRNMLEKENTKSKNMIIPTHRSYLVNLQHVSSIVRSELVMDNGIRIPVSRGSAKAVNAAFIQYYKG